MPRADVDTRSIAAAPRPRRARYKPRFKYVHSLVDRHGVQRYYFRKAGAEQRTLPGVMGSAEFLLAYAAAYKDATGETPAMPDRRRRARTAAAAVEGTASVVYFIRAGDRIKIGVTSNISRRMQALQTGHPEMLDLLHTMPGGRREERQFHEQFRALRIRNSEWFICAGELAELLDTLPNEWDQ